MHWLAEAASIDGLGPWRAAVRPLPLVSSAARDSADSTAEGLHPSAQEQSDRQKQRLQTERQLKGQLEKLESHRELPPSPLAALSRQALLQMPLLLLLLLPSVMVVASFHVF